MARSTLASLALLTACGLAVASAPAARAQPAGAAPAGASTMESTGSPHQDNALRMMVPVSVSFEDQRLEDVMTFIQEYTQAEIEFLWMDDDFAEGLDPEQLVTLEAENITALDLLERVLEQTASTDSLSTGNSWQMTRWGSIEAGPKERLNRPAARRLHIYDINDLLLVIPTYDNAPDFDLQSVLQSGGGGGGGGQSPFQENDEEDIHTIPREERAQEVIDLITQLVEVDAWTDNGGDAATITYYQGSLIVRAPDYVHRGIAGYPWWPSSRAVRRVSQDVAGTRWVSMSGMTAIAGPYQFRNVEASAVVGGQIRRSGPPGGGG
jgi:hypothetical protein